MTDEIKVMAARLGEMAEEGLLWRLETRDREIRFLKADLKSLEDSK
jgi:hypothetical protein